jgi:hypothetical protein
MYVMTVMFMTILKGAPLSKNAPFLGCLATADITFRRPTFISRSISALL